MSTALEDADHRPVRHGVEVRVGAHDHRALAAELEPGRPQHRRALAEEAGGSEHVQLARALNRFVRVARFALVLRTALRDGDYSLAVDALVFALGLDAERGYGLGLVLAAKAAAVAVETPPFLALPFRQLLRTS